MIALWMFLVSNFAHKLIIILAVEGKIDTQNTETDIIN